MVLCGGMLLYAALHDLIARTIPDAVPVGVAVGGVIGHVMSGQLPMPLIAAAAVALVAGLLFWWRLLGGGDAKLLAAVALLLPPAEVVSAAAAIAIAGGLLALLFLLLRPWLRGRRIRPAGRAAPLLRRALAAEAWRIRRGGPLPYAVAIAAGTLFTVISTGQG
jgi:prepilin peptidase CpaA